MDNKFKEAFYLEKCDKGYHGYHNYYNQIIGDAQVDSIMEIGVAWGDSLKAWRRIWPDAKIEALDLLRQYDLSLEKRFHIYNIDSTNKDKTDLIEKTYDVIVDDGEHDWNTQLRTFYNFYDKAKKFYVIEDIKGVRSLDLLLKNLPLTGNERFQIFVSHGHQRVFDVDGHSEKDSYRIMFIDKR